MIICLCGSSKFKKQFEEVSKLEGLKGNIVLTLPIFSQYENIELSKKEILTLKKLHKEKIKLADKIIIVNFNKYIGKNTQEEIEFAKKLNKKIENYF